MPVIPVLVSLRQKDHKLETSLARSYLEKQNRKQNNYNSCFSPFFCLLINSFVVFMAGARGINSQFYVDVLSQPYCEPTIYFLLWEGVVALLY
jgi:hypothetical protein